MNKATVNVLYVASLCIAVPALLLLSNSQMARPEERSRLNTYHISPPGDVFCSYGDKLLSGYSEFHYMEYSSIEQLLNDSPNLYVRGFPQDVSFVMPKDSVRVFSEVIPHDADATLITQALNEEVASARFYPDLLVMVKYSGLITLKDVTDSTTTWAHLDLARWPIIRSSDTYHWSDSDEPVGYTDCWVDLPPSPSEGYSVNNSAKVNAISKIMKVGGRIVLYNWARDILCVIDCDHSSENKLETLLQASDEEILQGKEIREGAIADDGSRIYIGTSTPGSNSSEVTIWRFGLSDDVVPYDVEKVGAAPRLYGPVHMEVWDNYILFKSFKDLGVFVCGPVQI